MSIIMKDLANKRWLRVSKERKWTENDEIAIDNAFMTGFKYIGALLALMLFLSALSTLAHAETIKIEKRQPIADVKLSKADRKLLISPEMESFKKRVSHTRVKYLGEVE